jgi:hypothetical protein
MLLKTIGALAIVAGVITAGAAPAAATVFYGNGHGDARVRCDAGTNRLAIQPTQWMSKSVAPQHGAWRIQIYSYVAKMWFTYRDWVYGSMNPYMTEDYEIFLPVDGRYAVYITYAWWTGTRWVARAEYTSVYTQAAEVLEAALVG